MGGFSLALGAFASGAFLRGQTPTQPMMEAHAVANDHRTALHQETSLAASASQIEDVLLDSKQFSALTKLPATIERSEGGKISMFGGLIEGRNIEIVPSTRIVQAWRPSHWDAGVYSVVRFVMKPNGASTIMLLDHTGFPEGQYKHLYTGWREHYFEPMKALFG